VALATVFAALALQVPASASVRVSAAPTLVPSFQRHVSDYVIRCEPGEATRISVAASHGDRVAVAGRAARGGRFTAMVRRGSSEAFTVRVRADGRTSTHHVRCLPPSFPTWEAKRRGRPQAQWYVLTPNGLASSGYAAIFDAHGVPVWWAHTSAYAPWDAKLLPNGDLAWARFFGFRFGQTLDEAYEERRLDGSLVRTISAVGGPTDTHDMEQLPDGNYLVLLFRKRSGVDLRSRGGPRDGTVLDGEVQELTPSGKRVWSWNSSKHIALAETQERWWRIISKQQKQFPRKNRQYDLVHINSVEPDGDGFVISLRCLDAVIRVDRTTGDVQWKLGGTHRPQSLSVKRDPHHNLPLAGQHDARLYRDGSLTVFDNGSYLDRPPRVVRYRIDTKARTATLLEDIRLASAKKSNYAGSARKLAGGNWAISWGGTRFVTEQTEAGKPALTLHLAREIASYRAAPIAHGVLSARRLRGEMDRLVAAGAGRSGVDSGP
jgi:hypothetical protein